MSINAFSFCALDVVFDIFAIAFINLLYFINQSGHVKGATHRYGGVHSCIMGNQGNMAGNSGICIGIQTSLFFRNLYTWCFLFEKSNLRDQRNNTLNLESKEVRTWSVFRKPQFFHTFSVIFILSNYRKCRQGFLKTDHGFVCIDFQKSPASDFIWRGREY